MKNICMTALVLFSVQCLAAQDNTIKWQTAVWSGFTDSKEALYNKLFETAFERQGLSLKTIEVPFNRSLKQVDQGRADFAGGVMLETEKSTKHILAPFPVFSTPVSVFYQKEKYSKSEINISMLEEHKVVGSSHVAQTVGLKNSKEVSAKEQGFFMVVKKHADFYVDNSDQMAAVIRENSNEIAQYNPDDYAIMIIGTSDAYMLAPNNTRGEFVIDAYIKGSKKLFDEGVMQKIYETRGFKIPETTKKYMQSLK